MRLDYPWPRDHKGTVHYCERYTKKITATWRESRMSLIYNRKIEKESTKLYRPLMVHVGAVQDNNASGEDPAAGDGRGGKVTQRVKMALYKFTDQRVAGSLLPSIVKLLKKRNYLSGYHTQMSKTHIIRKPSSCCTIF